MNTRGFRARSLALVQREYRRRAAGFGAMSERVRPNATNPPDANEVDPWDPTGRDANLRVCEEPGCGTRLSRYNEFEFCALHQPMVVPRMRGKVLP